MAATRRDVVMFVVGVAFAGYLPILAIPELKLLPLIEVALDATGAIPLSHVGVLAFVAILGAAWVDVGGRRDPPEEPEWDA